MKSRLIFLSLLFALTALAAVPQQINYQGYLTATDGSPLDTTVAMTFKLYTDSTAGSLLWTETRPLVSVANGLFNARLGQLTALGDAVFNNAQVWLGITVGNNSEMTPRTQYVSVPYAYRIGTVDGASGGTIVGKVNVGEMNSNLGAFANVFGQRDSANGDYSTVSGGLDNSTSGDYATVGGGSSNTASRHATVGGGASNTASSPAATVGGGADNSASYDYATVSGGSSNTASGDHATVGGGASNTASGLVATVGGGYSNTASDSFATVGGGGYNRARGIYAVVAGGGGASAADSNSANGDYSTISGGSINAASGLCATVGGGAGNTAYGIFATVGGGAGNTASTTIGSYYGTTVGGGFSNTASDAGTTVGGGANNNATGSSATVGGGEYNTANGNSATVGGGLYNTATGYCGTIPGGLNNSVSVMAAYSFAAGKNAYANDAGSFVWADSSGATFYSPGVNSFAVRASGGVRIATTSAGNVGVKLDNGDTAWEVLSDSTKKTNRRVVNTAGILSRLVQLPIEEWNYTHQDERNTHIGPMAQEFYRMFGYGDDDKSISTIDPDGIALAAIQELAKENDKLQAANFKLQTSNSKLQESNEELRISMRRYQDDVEILRMSVQRNEAELADLRTTVQSILADKQQSQR